jgi:hypothetical protein
MKKFLITSILTLLVASGSSLLAQDKPAEYLGLPGDNLNLYAVMDLFQKSETLEAFERALNDKDSRINNLDLNGDNYTDYITVNDHVEGDIHTIVLQDQLSRNEKQDIAVFTVERFHNGSVQIQLIGDEALYGRNYIIEPIYADNTNETPNPGYTGYNDNNRVVRTTYVEVAAWPMMRFIYQPHYTVWRSSWYWGYYPTYWHSWNPFYWDYYYGYYHNWYPEYYRHYRHWEHPRYTRYNEFYYSSIRSHSPEVNVRIKEGHYKSTYSHPEQRRDGEVLYTSLHSDRSSTSTGNNSASSSRRGSDSRSTEVTTPSRNNGSSVRRISNPNTSTSGRSESGVTRRSATNPSSGQNSNVSRRSTNSVTTKSVSTPASTPKGETVRSSVKPSTNVSTQSRRSVSNTKSAAPARTNNKTKDADKNDSSRRK